MSAYLSESRIANLPDAVAPLTGKERVALDRDGAQVDASSQDIADLAIATILAGTQGDVTTITDGPAVVLDPRPTAGGGSGGIAVWNIGENNRIATLANFAAGTSMTVSVRATTGALVVAGADWGDAGAPAIAGGVTDILFYSIDGITVRAAAKWQSTLDVVRIILVGGQSNSSRWMRESVAIDYATWPDYIKGANPGTLAAPSPEYFNGTTIEDWDTNNSGQAGMGHYWLTSPASNNVQEPGAEEEVGAGNGVYELGVYELGVYEDTGAGAGAGSGDDVYELGVYEPGVYEGTGAGAGAGSGDDVYELGVYEPGVYEGTGAGTGAGSGADEGTGAAFGFQDAAAYYLKKADPSTRYIFVEVGEGGSILGLTSIPANGSWNTNYAAVKTVRANGALLEALELRFDALVTALNAAGVRYVVDSMLFHQGETDGANATNASDYQANLTALIARVRDFTGVADLPFLFGTVSTRSSQFNANGATVRAAMKAVRDAVPNTYLRDMEDWAGRPSESPGVGSGVGGADSTASHFGGHTADKFGLWVAKKRGQVPVLPAWNVQHSYSGDRADLLAAFRAECTEGFDPSVIDIRSVDSEASGILATLGAQTHPNGKVYFAPDVSSTKIYAFNPVTDEIEVAATVGGQSTRAGIALAPNGLLVMAPGITGLAQNTWLVFNPTDAEIAGVAAGATTTVATVATDVASYGTILGSDGFIYAVPRDAGGTIRRLDPATLTESNFVATAPDPGGQYAGGTLSILDGRIYCAPQGAGRVLIIDTVAGTTSGALTTAVQGLSMTNGPDGNLYYGAFSADGEIIKVTPGESPSLGNFGSTLPGQHALTQIGPDGRLYCPPWAGTDRDLSSFDVQSGLVLSQVTTFPITPGTNFAAGALTTDGRMVVASKASAGNRRIAIIGEKRPGALSTDFVCSPYATNW